ncbi:MAG: ABC transporter substrate-binding protein [Aquabacterium sp.]
MSTLDRRQVFIATGAWLVACRAAQAQPAGRVYRLGYLAAGSKTGLPPRFLANLRELGYVEGQNLLVERRYAEGQVDRLPALAAELVRTNPDILVAGGTDPTRALMKVTGTVPIVFTASANPVGYGLVAHLARPGGNVTGASRADGEGLATKMLQLLKQAAPRLTQVSVLHTYDAGEMGAQLNRLQAAAGTLKLQVDAHQAETTIEFDRALATIGSAAGPGGTRGLVVTGSPYFDAKRDRLVQFAADKRLPAIYYAAGWVDNGGLMSYGPNTSELGRHVASYIDRILKGAKPGDLPVVLPTQFDLVINLKTAGTLGLHIPGTLQVSAARVVE